MKVTEGMKDGKEPTTVEGRSASPLPEVLILGTGAMAKLFGGRLVRQGLANVTLAGRWRDAVASMADEGICVEEARRSAGELGESKDTGHTNDSGVATDSDTTVVIAQVETRLLGDSPKTLIPDDLPAAGFDLILILVKSHQTETVAPVATHAVAPHGRILTLQNGVGNREALAAVANNAAQVSAGVTTAGATGLGPNRVRAGGPGLTGLGTGGDGPRSNDGPAASVDHGGSARLSIQSIAEMFRAAGFETETADDIDALLWRKLVVNCAINPLTALHGIPNGDLLEDEDLRRQMAKAALEVVAVARALGVQLGEGFDPVAAAETVARKTQGNRSSMLQDMDRGAKTEIDAICGAVVKEGRRLGVPTPINARLWAEVKAREEGVGTDTERPRRLRSKRRTAPMEVNA